MARGTWLLATWALLATPARAGEAACQGTLRGAVEGTFRCTVEARPDGEAVGLSVTALGPVGESRSFAPGGFQLAAPLRAGTYRLGDMQAARSSIIASTGALYSATRTSGQRGEVTLTLSSVAGPKGGAYRVHGTLHAVLLPSGSPRQDSVTLDVEF